MIQKRKHTVSSSERYCAICLYVRIGFSHCNRYIRNCAPGEKNTVTNPCFETDERAWKSYEVAVNDGCKDNTQTQTDLKSAISKSTFKMGTGITEGSKTLTDKPNLVSNEYSGFTIEQNFEITLDWKGGKKLKWFTNKGQDFDGPSLSYNTCPGAMIQTGGVEIKIEVSGRNSVLI